MSWICDNCATAQHGSKCGNCGGDKKDVER